MKKFWKYFLITLLLILGIACIGVLYLMFIPNSSLFGISYVGTLTKNAPITSVKYAVSEQSIQVIQTVELENYNYEVNVLESSDKNVYIKIKNNTYGFAVKDSKTLWYEDNKAHNGVLKFTVHEPVGLVLNNNSLIELYIPKNTEINLKLTNNKSKTTINGKDLKFKNIDYASNKGNLYLVKGAVYDKLNLNLNNSNCEISSTFVTTTCNLIISTNSGNLSAETNSFNNLKINNLSIGSINIGNCNNFEDTIASAGGRIKINKAINMSVTTSDTNIEINEVSTIPNLKLTKYGNISIQKITGYANLSTEAGNINIGEVQTETLILNTVSGSINISKAYYKIILNSNKGSININYDDEAPNYNTTNYARSLNATINKGYLNASGVDNIVLSITSTGTANITMNNITSENILETENGHIYLKADKDDKYKLTTESPLGSVRVNLTQIPEYNGYTIKEFTATYVNTTLEEYEGLTAKNSLQIKNKYGSIVVLDSNFY